MVRYCRLVNLSETEMVKSWPEMENPGVIAQANLEALVIKRLSWPQPDQPLGLGIRVPPRHGHLKLMIDSIGHLTLIGMRGDNLISLSFLDQILSADFLSKLSKLLKVKIDIN